MKRDGRLLDHRTLETIRLMAVERVLDGERPSSVVTSYGFNRTTIYRWLSAAATPGVGLRALRAKPATGRPRSLTSHQEKQVFRWINGHDPRQYGLNFGLWTRSLVAELIERKFAIRLGSDDGGRIARQAGIDRRKAAGQDRGATQRHQARASVDTVILQCTQCRLYYRLVSKSTGQLPVQPHSNADRPAAAMAAPSAARIVSSRSDGKRCSAGRDSK